MGINPDQRRTMKHPLTLLALLSALTFVACASSNNSSMSKAEILDNYRAQHGVNWDSWSPEVREQFKKDMQGK